jgi:hypothetical protein
MSIMRTGAIILTLKKWYDYVCAKMVEERAAIELPDKVWLDYCFYVDEVGDNTNKKDDGNTGGTKYVTSIVAHDYYSLK